MRIYSHESDAMSPDIFEFEDRDGDRATVKRDGDGWYSLGASPRVVMSVEDVKLFAAALLDWVREYKA